MPSVHELAINPAGIAAASAVVGVLVGLTGVGGGALMTPILILGFDIPPVQAIATDLMFAAMTKCCSGAVHMRRGSVDWQVVRRLWTGSIPACIVVGALVAWGTVGDWSEVMNRPIGVIIAISGASLLLGRKVHTARRESRVANPSAFKRLQAPLTVGSGFLLGSVVSATSVGAGAIGAALLRALYPLRMNPLRLVATDTIHAIPVALLAGGTYAALGKTDWPLLGWMLLGGIPAAIVSSALASKVPTSALRGLLGVALIGIAAKMVLN
ncbi:MAG: sulfite exporter TauE/SafE family protein [Planctomycetota bacterium]|nr:sulfite exporter TauE/SafE family protein [Planctomycetota bacterium]